MRVWALKQFYVYLPRYTTYSIGTWDQVPKYAKVCGSADARLIPFSYAQYAPSGAFPANRCLPKLTPFKASLTEFLRFYIKTEMPLTVDRIIGII